MMATEVPVEEGRLLHTTMVYAFGVDSSTPAIRIFDVSSTESTAEGCDQPETLNSPPITPESSKRQWRRSSWCPEEERKKEEKQEMQRSLAVVGKRYVLFGTLVFANGKMKLYNRNTQNNELRSESQDRRC